MEKGDPDIMEQPPRPVHEPIINRFMVVGAVVQTIAITMVVLTAYFLGLGWEPSSPLLAQTMAFVTLVMSELFRAYTARSERYPLLKLGLFTNKFMQYAIAFSVFLLLIVVYIPVPAVNEIFNTTPITLSEWGVMIPLILLPSVVAEIWKAYMNRSHRAA